MFSGLCNSFIELFQLTFLNFDNIPDSLFPSGKPGSLNTNKANSQRCSIILIKPSSHKIILSSKLISWKKNERKKILGAAPQVYDITDVSELDQFIRPFNNESISIVKRKSGIPLISLIKPKGSHKLFLASVARNFISFRKNKSNFTIDLFYENRRDLLIFFAVINSQDFFWYWKTVGDGFHISQSIFQNYFIKKNHYDLIINQIDRIEEILSEKNKFAKKRILSGKPTISYDFSKFFWKDEIFCKF